MLNKFNITYEKEDFDKIGEAITSSVSFKGANLWILVFAIFIASLGLNVNSTAVIIGAMLISPLMGPIMGIGYAMAINDIQLLKKSYFSYIFATSVALATSTFYFLLSPLNDAHSEILARTSPNIYDVLIALFGGLAGMLATSTKLKGNVIPGVAIATALMPPLCTAGYGLATLKFDFFFGAFYLFIINTVFIALATLVVGRFLNFPYKHLPKEEDELKAKRIVLFVVLLTLLPSIYLGYDLVVKNRIIEQINQFVEKEAHFSNDYLLKKSINLQNKTITLVYGGELIGEAQINTVKSKLADYGLSDFKVDIKQGFGYLQEDKKSETNASVIALNEKDKVIEMLQTKLDSIADKQELHTQIFKELKVQVNQVDTLILMPTLAVSDSNNTKTWVAIISAKKNIDKKEKAKIESWLKVRINATTLKVIFD
ncbi:MAG: DUF389 domain-containing protein [Chitinophagales bacterium]|mgnify:FL=1|nr:DUF389 domain-containing protein [Chitinophagales bacterium]